MKRIAFLLLTLMLVLFSTNTIAQLPRVINYQGILLGSNEQPVPEGHYKITFRLYDEANNQLWSEVHNQLFVGGGHLHVFLGSKNPLILPFDKGYFLGIQVGNEPELQPRMFMAAVPYSFRADDANHVGGIGACDVPTPNTLFPLGSDGKFPSSVLPAGISGNYLKKNVSDTSRGTCAAPMLLISNLGDGDGINGRGQKGIGVSGRSEKNDGMVGWTGTADKSGVFGGSTYGRGVVGRSEKNDGVVGWTGAGDKSGVFGHSIYSRGVVGCSDKNSGVYGWTGTSGGEMAGVTGFSVNGTGVTGRSDQYNGIKAITKSNIHAALAAGNEGGGPAIYAQGGTDGVAAIFRGNVKVQSLSTQATIIELGEGLDYAEGFNVSNNTKIAPGTVLIIDPDNPGKLVISDKAYDHKVAGIVAGARGIGSGVRLGVDKFDHDVALAGRVYCNVDASETGIEPGDLLTTSPTPGHAMKSTDYVRAQGAILGKAMQSLRKGEKGQILVLVTLQ